MSKYTYVSLKELIPKVPKGLAIILCVLNIIFPGLGTVMLACVGNSFVPQHLVVGLLQFITAVCIVGWIWSILWGIFLVMKS
jgi:hypothetical protein